MNNITFRNLHNDELNKSFIKALSWDSEKKFTNYNVDEFEEFMSMEDTYGLFLNNELIGYGTISKFKMEYNHCYISYIINPNYRKMGFAKMLLKHLLLEIKKRKSINTAIAEIDDDNFASIFTVLDNGFNLMGSNKKTLFFKRNLDDSI